MYVLAILVTRLLYDVEFCHASDTFSIKIRSLDSLMRQNHNLQGRTMLNDQLLGS
jgi:hypothetical protein